jgi:hypothetical protein
LALVAQIFLMFTQTGTSTQQTTVAVCLVTAEEYRNLALVAQVGMPI